MIERSNPRRLLAANPFFAGLCAEALDAIAALSVQRSLEAGRTLFEKGDPGDALYAIRRGQVRIVVESGEGRRRTLNLLGAGDVFGEVALLDGRPRTATAVAAETTALFVVLRRDLLALISRQPSVSVQLIDLLCARIRWLSAQAEENAFLSLDRRIVRQLLKLSEDYGEAIVTSQQELAAQVGASRESVNRHLQVWRKDGLIGLSRGRIQLLDSKQLARIDED